MRFHNNWSIVVSVKALISKLDEQAEEKGYCLDYQNNQSRQDFVAHLKEWTRRIEYNSVYNPGFYLKSISVLGAFCIQAMAYELRKNTHKSEIGITSIDSYRDRVIFDKLEAYIEDGLYRDYLEFVLTVFPNPDRHIDLFINFALGVVGETDELESEINRFKNNTDMRKRHELASEIVLELGDVLWYSSALLLLVDGSYHLETLAECYIESAIEVDGLKEVQLKGSLPLIEIMKKYAYHHKFKDGEEINSKIEPVVLINLEQCFKTAYQTLKSHGFIKGASPQDFFDMVVENNINKLSGRYKGSTPQEIFSKQQNYMV